MAEKPKVQIHVAQGEFDYSVYLSNFSEHEASCLVDFSQSENLVLHEKGRADRAGDLAIQVLMPARVEHRVLVAVLEHAKRGQSHKFHYDIKMKQQAATGNEHEEGGGDDEVTKVADGLSLIVRSVETGYKLFVKNENKTTGYTLEVDLSPSTNIKVAAQGNGQQAGPMGVSVKVPPGAAFGLIADCPVADMSTGSCEIQYKIKARPGV
jgi:hypothetical protein